MSDVYKELRTHFREVPGVAVAEGRGAQGLKLGKKMFAMFYKGELLLKLPPERVEALISSGRAKPHDPGTGTVMRDRALVPESEREQWFELCQEALRHARGS